MPPQQQQMPPQRKRSNSHVRSEVSDEEEEDVEVFDSFLDTKATGAYVITGDFNGKIVLEETPPHGFFLRNFRIFG